MKKITIYTVEKSDIVLIDDDDTELTMYTKQVTKLMEMSKVCILETTSCNLLLKPSKISFITVEELLAPEIEKSVIKAKDSVAKIKNNSDIIRD